MIILCSLDHIALRHLHAKLVQQTIYVILLDWLNTKVIFSTYGIRASRLSREDLCVTVFLWFIKKTLFSFK